MGQLQACKANTPQLHMRPGGVTRDTIRIRRKSIAPRDPPLLATGTQLRCSLRARRRAPCAGCASRARSTSSRTPTRKRMPVKLG